MIKKLLAAAVLSLGFGVAVAAQDQGASFVKATHGAWEVRCSNADNSKCVMTQTGNNAEGQPVLQALLRRTPGMQGPNGEPVAAVFELLAPIGVLLPAGIAVSIDGAEIGRVPYRVCNPQSCLVAEPVLEDFIGKMKKGSNAVMTMVGVNGQAASVTISLSGFTKAYNGL